MTSAAFHSPALRRDRVRCLLAGLLFAAVVPAVGAALLTLHAVIQDGTTSSILGSLGIVLSVAYQVCAVPALLAGCVMSWMGRFLKNGVLFTVVSALLCTVLFIVIGPLIGNALDEFFAPDSMASAVIYSPYVFGGGIVAALLALAGRLAPIQGRDPVNSPEGEG